MERKKCIKPNCGIVYKEIDQEFKDGCCECGCILELIIKESTEEVAVTKVDFNDNNANDKKNRGLKGLPMISEDGTIIFPEDNLVENTIRYKKQFIDLYYNGQVHKIFAINSDEFIIGRSSIDSNPDIDLSDIDPNKKTSRNHVMIYRLKNEYFIRNLSNKNSVHVNGNPIPFGKDIKIHDDTEIVLSNFIGLYFYEEDKESDDSE